MYSNISTATITRMFYCCYIFTNEKTKNVIENRMYFTFLYTVLNIKIRDGKGRCTNYRCTILLNLGKIGVDYVIRFMHNQQVFFGGGVGRSEYFEYFKK